MKALTWDAVSKLYKEIVTGRIFTASSEPGDIADGDLWVDSSATPVLKAKVAGVIYEVVGAGGGGGDGYLESVSASTSFTMFGGPMVDGATLGEDVSLTESYSYTAATTETPTVILY